jgi:hypothetical protein
MKYKFLLSLSLICSVAAARATIISLDYTGTITAHNVFEPIYHAWTASLGDTVSGHLLIDTATHQQLINPTHAFYEDAILEWTITLNGNSVRRAADNFVISDFHVFNNEPTQVYDRFFLEQWNDATDTSIFLNGVRTAFESANGWQLDLMDLTGTAIDSLGIPHSINPDAFDFVRGGCVTDGHNGTFSHSIDKIVISQHPEHPEHPEHPPHGGGNHVPDAGSTLAMLGMALCTLGGIARHVKA